MYVPPRPVEADDPLFAVRLALAPVIGVIIGIVLRSPMAMLYPVLAFSLMAGTRKALDPRRALGGGIALPAMLFIMSWLVSATLNTPLLLVLVMTLAFFAGFFLIARTGNPAGMLIIVAALMCSIMGMGNYTAMIYLRDEMSKAAFFGGLITLVLYLLIPTATKEKAVDIYVPYHEDQMGLRVAIRTFVLLLLAFWLYTILDSSNVMLAVSALFVLTFPTRETVFNEAKERSLATIMGGFAGIAILLVVSTLAQLEVVLALTFLATLFFSQKMMTGRLPAPVYQYAASVMISIIAGGLTMQEPSYAFLTRAVLTMAGTIGAAFLVSLIEALLLRHEPEDDQAIPEYAP